MRKDEKGPKKREMNHSMFIAPILFGKQSGDITMMWVFLERNGTHLITVDGLAEATEFLEQNGFKYTSLTKKGDVLYAIVSPTTDLSQFYTWTEVPPGTIPTRELWRPFIWTSVSQGTNEFLKTIPLAPSVDAYSLLAAATP